MLEGDHHLSPPCLPADQLRATQGERMVANDNLNGIYNMITIGVINHLSDQRNDPLNEKMQTHQRFVSCCDL